MTHDALTALRDQLEQAAADAARQGAAVAAHDLRRAVDALDRLDEADRDTHPVLFEPETFAVAAAAGRP